MIAAIPKAITIDPSMTMSILYFFWVCGFFLKDLGSSRVYRISGVSSGGTGEPSDVDGSEG